MKVEEIAAGGTPPLAEVRPLVEREWRNARRQEAAKAFYENLRAKYAVTVKMPGPGAPASGSARESTATGAAGTTGAGKAAGPR